MSALSHLERVLVKNRGGSHIKKNQRVLHVNVRVWDDIDLSLTQRRVMLEKRRTAEEHPAHTNIRSCVLDVFDCCYPQLVSVKFVAFLSR